MKNIPLENLFQLTCCCSAFCEATVFAIGVATKVESSSFSTFPVIFIMESSFIVGFKFFLAAKA